MIYRIVLPLAFVVALTLPLAVSADTTSGTLTAGIQTGISGIVDAAPSASPGAGTYTSAQSVTLSAADSDSIHYTTDGTEPTCTTGTMYVDGSPLSVSSSETIRAVACYNGFASAVATFAYGINLPAAPSGGGGGGGGGGSFTPPASNLVGDINHDGKVDILDFSILMSEWGQTGSSVSADLNHDGVVDILDFTILLANWTG
ncbi:MAG: chitobiase/beta-hexosaminidase C-terminal domain-containing protein [Minisyncoccia bacterium]